MVPPCRAVFAFLLAVASTVTVETDAAMDYTDVNRLGDAGERLHPQTKRYYFGYRYGNDHHPGRRQLDRFRFALIGLGKRSIPESIDGLEKVDDRRDSADELFHVQNILKGRLSSCKTTSCRTRSDKPSELPNSETGMDLRKSAIRVFKKLLRSSDSYRDIAEVLSGETLEGKRVPEEFSQDLYPIQAGTQQIEANLDKTFTDIPRLPAMMSVKILHPAPPYVEPELELDEYNTDPVDIQGEKETEMIDNKQETSDPQEVTSEGISGVPRKRWWATRSFNRFRTPKSNRMHFYPRHIDPVLYFLGLGK